MQHKGGFYAQYKRSYTD